MAPKQRQTRQDPGQALSPLVGSGLASEEPPAHPRERSLLRLGSAGNAAAGSGSVGHVFPTACDSWTARFPP